MHLAENLTSLCIDLVDIGDSLSQEIWRNWVAVLILELGSLSSGSLYLRTSVG